MAARRRIRRTSRASPICCPGFSTRAPGRSTARPSRRRSTIIRSSLSFDAGRDTFGGSLRTLVENRDEAGRSAEARADRAALRSRSRSNGSAPRSSPASRRMSATPAKWREPGADGARFPGPSLWQPTEGTPETRRLDHHRRPAGLFQQDRRQGQPEDRRGRRHRRRDPCRACSTRSSAICRSRRIASASPRSNRRPAATSTIPMSIPQTVIQIAGKGLKRDDPDFIPASVAAYILGGGSFSSRLYEEVREKRGPRLLGLSRPRARSTTPGRSSSAPRPGPTRPTRWSR